ncbi:alpha/beta fold hydrolase [Blastomonas sp.]|uniref:alpha/beta fold hydrolase n=1 Tax=Blastomonas sp. TaxID=1909299 RepID=UPI00359423D3
MTLTGPASNSFYSQRLRLHYADWDNHDAPPLILLHGGQDHCRSWDWVAGRLTKDWHVIAPDLRGHGDSQWSADGHYPIMSLVYDLAQLVHQFEYEQVTIVAHSLGGNVALRYTGLYPEKVRKIVAIEGLGPSPRMLAEREKTPFQERWRSWIDDKRAAATRQHRSYASFDEALARMHGENSYLNAEQARHLTSHAVIRNEDGTYSWKFDPHIRVWPILDIAHGDMETLWQRITCPTLLCWGEKSWASDPEIDGRLSLFPDARLAKFADAGHWLHHDQFDRFMAELAGFL